MLTLTEYTERLNEQAKGFINLEAEVEIQKEHLRAEFAKAIPASGRYSTAGDFDRVLAV